MGHIGSPETSVLNQLTPCNNPEDGRTHKCIFNLYKPRRVRVRSNYISVPASRELKRFCVTDINVEIIAVYAKYDTKRVFDVEGNYTVI